METAKKECNLFCNEMFLSDYRLCVFPCAQEAKLQAARWNPHEHSWFTKIHLSEAGVEAQQSP